MAVSIDDIRKLKELTGVGLTDAKAALVEADGDFDAALAAMRKKGLTRAEKKGEREARAGIIDSYIHDRRIGVLVELNCETDFVARLDDFKSLAHEIALQVAAMNPSFVSSDKIPEEEMARLREEARARALNEGKSADIAERMVEGQVKKHFAEQVLLNQPYFRDDSKTIDNLVKEAIAKLGENIVVRRFYRMELGVND